MNVCHCEEWQSLIYVVIANVTKAQCGNLAHSAQKYYEQPSTTEITTLTLVMTDKNGDYHVAFGNAPRNDSIKSVIANGA